MEDILELVFSVAVEIVKVIKDNKKPMTIDELDEKLNYEHPDHIKAIASISKQLATLNGLWGLAKWPSVNPKNIRDKIFVILESHKEPMHFSDIAKEKNIPNQLEVMGAKTGTNADMIAVNREGVKTCTLSIPLRNMHTYNEVIVMEDCKSLYSFVKAFASSNEIARDFRREEIRL